MASEMLEKVLAAEKQSESSIATAKARAAEIIAQAQEKAEAAISECRSKCAKNSAAAAAITAEKCREIEKQENSRDAAAMREMLAGVSGARAAATHAVREMILKAQ